MDLVLNTAEVYEPLLHPARYKGAHGGRGSGKSHFFAEMLIEDHIRERIDSVCLREIQKSLKFSVKKLLETKIEAMNAGAYFEVQEAVIKAKNGGTIIFQGMQDHTSDSIKSLDGFKRAWFEEAQTRSSYSEAAMASIRALVTFRARTMGQQRWTPSCSSQYWQGKTSGCAAHTPAQTA